ncbi:hypothetical protein MCACP_26650 [Neomoorella carbonis]
MGSILSPLCLCISSYRKIAGKAIRHTAVCPWQFSATLEQYQAKVAQVNAATDSVEKEKLTREAKALEEQLSAWDQETKQHTIILWLETK